MSTLCLTRHQGEAIRLRVGDVTIWIGRKDDQVPGEVGLFIDAPPDVEILREEKLPESERRPKQGRRKKPCPK